MMPLPLATRHREAGDASVWSTFGPHAEGSINVYYEEHGRADGPPLVLLHGFTVTGRIT